VEDTGSVNHIIIFDPLILAKQLSSLISSSSTARAYYLLSTILMLNKPIMENDPLTSAEKKELRGIGQRLKPQCNRI
jgi:hypothetical protein